MLEILLDKCKCVHAKKTEPEALADLFNTVGHCFIMALTAGCDKQRAGTPNGNKNGIVFFVVFRRDLPAFQNLCNHRKESARLAIGEQCRVE